MTMPDAKTNDRFTQPVPVDLVGEPAGAAAVNKRVDAQIAQDPNDREWVQFWEDIRTRALADAGGKP
jgi:hypothetical protein